MARARLVVTLAACLSLAACSAPPAAPTPPPAAPSPASPAPTAAPAPPTTAPAPPAPTQTALAQVEHNAALKPLALSPEKGVVGSTFTAKLDGLRPGQEVAFDWGTWDGSYQTTTSAEVVQYDQRAFAPKRVPLGRATADGSGVATATFTTPEDYGEVHDVFATVDGADLARGGYRVQFSATMTPSEGPIGTPVTIKVTGMSAMLFSGATLAVRYDNAYTGLLTATTTKGTAVAKLRAAGPVGPHTVVLNAGSVPAYLNIAQSPYDFVYQHLPDKEDVRLPFKVTKDAGPPEDQVEWPDAGTVAQLAPDAPRTTADKVLGSTPAALDPASGPIRTKTTLRAGGLAPGQPVDAFWVTARGNRVTPSGWALQDAPIAKGTAGADGSLALPLDVPDDLGGWHVVKLVQAGKVMGEAPFYVERSLEGASARTVKNGETVTFHLKGLGWTELDNGFAMTYDNQFAGYACGFNSNGDVVLQVLATGGQGAHLVDLYPMVYAGKDKKPWYWAPVLTFGRDFPALGLGYRLPAFRLAIEVTE